jgi:hypothetical protein
MPPDYPHFGQVSAKSCGIECMRMALQTVTGEPVARARVKARMIEKGVYQEGGSAGAQFDALDRVVRSPGPIAMVLKGPAAAAVLAGSLYGSNSVALVECRNSAGQGHCIVVDSAAGQGNQLTFQVRDPAAQDVEPAVNAADPRLAGNHRFWIMSS